MVSADKPRPADERTSEIVDELPEEELTGCPVCYYEGVGYSPGSVICRGGLRMICTAAGSWYKLGSC